MRAFITTLLLLAENTDPWTGIPEPDVFECVDPDNLDDIETTPAPIMLVHTEAACLAAGGDWREPYLLFGVGLCMPGPD